MKDKEKYNAYMREYMLNRYKQFMADAINSLGGKCTKCNALEKLQLDHIDPSTKQFTIGKSWSINKEKFWLEVNKCQVLCSTCHEIKTINDLGQSSGKSTHGTLSSYRYCKCDICKKANSDYNKEYRRKRKLLDR